MKATYGVVNGEERAIFKDPKTSKGAFSKKSAKGLIAAFNNPDGTIRMKDQATWDEVNNCAFREVFVDGKELNTNTLAEIRARVMG
jgi:nicotinamide phosphoribosyltransferase